MQQQDLHAECIPLHHNVNDDMQSRFKVNQHVFQSLCYMLS